MIATPRGFEPLALAADDAQPVTLAFRGNELLLREDDLGPPHHDVLRPSLDAERLEPIGRWNGRYFRATWLEAAATAPPGHAFRGLRSLFGRSDEAFVAIAGRALQIADWARTHRFCGACGQRMQRSPTERVMRCACGHSAYPRVAPAMMALVKRGDHILLARNAAVPPGGRMSALAGFVEPGESVEDTVHREVREEVGLEVQDLRYFASQSWPFPHSLMIAFTCEYAGGEIRCAPDEIGEARWFGPGDALPEFPPPFSVSHALIMANLPGGRQR
jgi:NAD+ diphosphatase